MYVISQRKVTKKWNQLKHQWQHTTSETCGGKGRGFRARVCMCMCVCSCVCVFVINRSPDFAFDSHALCLFPAPVYNKDDSLVKDTRLRFNETERGRERERGIEKGRERERGNERKREREREI